jgi:hypothetical protein
MKIFEKLLDKLFEKIANKISKNYYKWHFEKIGDVLIVHVPVGSLPSGKMQQYLKYAKEAFDKHLEALGVKEIICVELREIF